MDFTTHFPFSIPLKFSNIDRPFHLGHFSNSDWSLLVDSRQHVRIIRSNEIGGFAINANLSFYNVQRSTLLWKHHWIGFIIEDEKSVMISSKGNGEGTNTFFAEFRGTVSILQLRNTMTENLKASSELTENLKTSLESTEKFLRLLNNSSNIDSTLMNIAGIKVHKGVLSVRSPVVAEMLNQMQESSSSIVDVMETEPNVLEATLKYVYSGNSVTIAGHLLCVADKYKLEELKRVCVNKLKSSMTVDNVFRILVLGDLHDESLKTYAKEFVCRCDKFSNLEKTEEWKLLLVERTGLAVELLTFVIKYLEQISNKSIVTK